MKKKTKRYANMYDGDGSVYYKVDLSRQDIFLQTEHELSKLSIAYDVDKE